VFFRKRRPRKLSIDDCIQENGLYFSTKGVGSCMQSPQNSSQEKKPLLSESEELRAQARELLRTSNKLIEQLKANMRKFEELLKQKDKR